MVPTGPFDLAHATAVARAVEQTAAASGRGAARSMSTLRSSIGSTAPAQSCWHGSSTGWTRADASTHIVEEQQPGSGAPDRPLSRTPGGTARRLRARATTALARIGAAAAELPGTAQQRT